MLKKLSRKFWRTVIMVIHNPELVESIDRTVLIKDGKIKTFEKEVNLNADKKRFWLGEIESIDSRTMNESMPISMTYFKKNEI